ncbi:hypothetical protein CJ469_06394 [Nocardia farcinica]|nr:hypothetical protein CJ469_06394 [Nocardia farcinica]SLH53058.1 Uncharacterised protein [Mycobacteroides abscessus subsp. abscessus]
MTMPSGYELRIPRPVGYWADPLIPRPEHGAVGFRAGQIAEITDVIGVLVTEDAR